MKVTTRFAPSPTGFLHIGGARTAIFNYLFARHHNGKFLLRVEDTDQQRSSEDAIEAIYSGLQFLGLDYDSDAIIQSKNINRHVEIANILLQTGKAYKCFMTQKAIDEQRESAVKNSQSFLLKSPWRDSPPTSHPNEPYVVRIKAPEKGNIIINDMVQGEVSVDCSILDDLVLVRSDGSPTYMLAVVVDDHDMGVTHIIRGDDHLNNAFRQKIIYEAMDWDVPIMAHIPLIHGDDGAKLSKRHGALGIEAYRDMGYLPDAIFNYLLRLGWSHGDDEIISRKNAINWFDGKHIGKSPSRIDFGKMKHINSIYIRNLNNNDAIDIIKHDWIASNIELSNEVENNLKKALPEILVRSEFTHDVSEIAKIYHTEDIFPVSKDAEEILAKMDIILINKVYELIENLISLEKDNIQSEFKKMADSLHIKMSDLMKPVRAIITGRTSSPSVFEIISIIGKEAALVRLGKYASR